MSSSWVGNGRERPPPPDRGHSGAASKSRRSEPYCLREGCRQHRLLYQRCAECGFSGLGNVPQRLRPMPRGITGVGGRKALGWESLYSWTVVWRPPDPSFQVPYAPAVIRLDEGFWMMSAVIGCEPEVLSEDLRVAVEFHRVSDEITLPYFHPA